MKIYCFLWLLCLCGITSMAQQSTASASVSTFTIQSPQLDVSKKIWVYLPYNYATSAKKYPVIYMHDGQNLFDKSTSYSGEWRVDETLDSLKAEVIVIGIEHSGERRMAELTPYVNAEHGGGDADIYLDFIISTLKPHVDSLYRTKPERKHTSIFGSSLGGLVSYYAIVKYPEVFGNAGVFSPSFWFTKDIYELTENAKSIDSKIYFMAGNSESNDMVPDLNRMENFILTKVKKPKEVYKKIVPGGKHNEALWAKEFAQAYLWLMQ